MPSHTCSCIPVENNAMCQASTCMQVRIACAWGLSIFMCQTVKTVIEQHGSMPWSGVTVSTFSIWRQMHEPHDG
jgi:hypothetical protein